MGIKDILNASKFKAENENLKSLMTPEMQDASVMMSKIRNLQEQLASLESEIAKQSNALNGLNTQIAQKQSQIITFNDDILVQEFGLYTPRYSYNTSDDYKEHLSRIRNQQKLYIKNGNAVTGNMNFTYNNSLSKGNKMVKDKIGRAHV